MTADDTSPDLAPIPSAAEIVRYMRSAGWTHGRQGSHGAMWVKGDVEFSVPHEDHNADWLREVVGRLASAEGRTPEETAAAIAAYRDARAATKPCGCGPLQPCREHLGRGAEMDADALAVTSPAPDPGESSGTATGPAEGGWRERAERAEAKLAKLREHAETWAALAPADDWGLTPTDTVAADCGRAILAIIGTGETGHG
jgi:hypothetical protein